MKREAVLNSDGIVIAFKVTLIGYDYDTRTVDTDPTTDNLPDTDSVS